MPSDKLRRQIVFEAARLMYQRQETEYYQAKLKAARKLCGGWVKETDLPSNFEIHDEIQRFAHLYEGTSRTDKLREMRIEALRVMRLLSKWKPRLIGSTLTGHVRKGSDIDIHVFSSSVEAVTHTLDQEGFDYEVERKRIRKHGEERVFTHVHIHDRFAVELTLYNTSKTSHVFKSSITGKAMQRASIAELQQLLQTEYADLVLDEAIVEAENKLDRFSVYRSLLIPLESVKQSAPHHPEGDVLYHSLQVFDHACDELPYDEEFLLAALLHDVGKAIDPYDHVQAGLEALQDFVSKRTAWLITNHMAAHALRQRSIGTRARKRLQQSDDYEELLLLSECDQAGRVPGVETTELNEALDYIRNLAKLYG